MLRYKNINMVLHFLQTSLKIYYLHSLDQCLVNYMSQLICWPRNHFNESQLKFFKTLN